MPGAITNRTMCGGERQYRHTTRAPACTPRCQELTVGCGCDLGRVFGCSGGHHTRPDCTPHTRPPAALSRHSPSRYTIDTGYSIITAGRPEGMHSHPAGQLPAGPATLDVSVWI